MKTLETFWHYVDNEQPPCVGPKILRTLSPWALQAYVSACAFVDGPLQPISIDCPRQNARRIVRDLSLALCVAFQRAAAQRDEINEAAFRGGAWPQVPGK